jgi:hypothetical protein
LNNTIAAIVRPVCGGRATSRIGGNGRIPVVLRRGQRRITRPGFDLSAARRLDHDHDRGSADLNDVLALARLMVKQFIRSNCFRCKKLPAFWADSGWHLR